MKVRLEGLLGDGKLYFEIMKDAGIGVEFVLSWKNKDSDVFDFFEDVPYWIREFLKELHNKGLKAPEHISKEYTEFLIKAEKYLEYKGHYAGARFLTGERNEKIEILLQLASLYLQEGGKDPDNIFRRVMESWLQSKREAFFRALGKRLSSSEPFFDFVKRFLMENPHMSNWLRDWFDEREDSPFMKFILSFLEDIRTKKLERKTAKSLFKKILKTIDSLEYDGFKSHMFRAMTYWIFSWLPDKRYFYTMLFPMSLSIFGPSKTISEGVWEQDVVLPPEEHAGYHTYLDIWDGYNQKYLREILEEYLQVFSEWHEKLREPKRFWDEALRLWSENFRAFQTLSLYILAGLLRIAHAPSGIELIEYKPGYKDFYTKSAISYTVRKEWTHFRVQARYPDEDTIFTFIEKVKKGQITRSDLNTMQIWLYLAYIENIVYKKEQEKKEYIAVHPYRFFEFVVKLPEGLYRRIMDVLNELGDVEEVMDAIRVGAWLYEESGITDPEKFVQFYELYLRYIGSKAPIPAITNYSHMKIYRMLRSLVREFETMDIESFKARLEYVSLTAREYEIGTISVYLWLKEYEEKGYSTEIVTIAIQRACRDIIDYAELEQEIEKQIQEIIKERDVLQTLRKKFSKVRF